MKTSDSLDRTLDDERLLRTPNPSSSSAGDIERLVGPELDGSRGRGAAAAARPSKARTKVFRGDVQGLRAVAVLAVVADHLIGHPSGGFVGVDVFFVISGFLITGLLLREHERTGRISLGDFYRRRVRRIAPAAVLVLLATSIGAVLVFNSVRAAATLQDAGWAVAFLANWRFAAIGTDYFAAAGPVSPLQHFWSLAVEEQFYVVWPAVIIVIGTIARKRSASHRAFRIAVLAAIAVILVASLAWSLHDTRAEPAVAYFSTFARGWELAAGALLAVVAPLLGRFPTPVRLLLRYGGLGMILVAFLVIDSASAVPAPWAALPVAGAVAVILAGGESSGRSVIDNVATRYVGDISYSLYLWHFPVFIFGHAVLGTGTRTDLALLLIAGIVSVYSFHLVEDPIRRSRWLLGGSRPGTQERVSRRGRRALVGSFAALAASGVLVVAIAGPSLAAVPVPAVGAVDAHPAGPQAAALQQEIRASLGARSWPATKPSLDQVIGTTGVPADITRCSPDTRIDADCVWGDPRAHHTIVMVGSSLSLAYVAGMRAAVGTHRDWRVISYGMFACPFDSPDAIRAELPTVPVGCIERTSIAVAAINRLKPDAVVFTGLFTATGPASEIARIDPAVKLVFMPGPPADADIASCYNHLSGPAACITRIPFGWSQPERLAAASPTRPGVFIDTRDWFCVQDLCPAFVGTTPMKVDSTHLTTRYSVRLGPIIREALHAAGIM